MERTVIPWEEIFAILERFLRALDPPAVEQAAGSGAADGEREPFRVLVATVISARTRDEVTLEAAERLLARAGDPAALAALDEGEIARLVYPAGFYRTKARNLKRLAGRLQERHGGQVPAEMDALLELPGVGRKTANLVRNLGFGLEGICVDTHVHRIANRLGWVSTPTPALTEAALARILPTRYWIPVNGMLVRFGQTVCTPLSPRCSRCPLAGHCRRVGVRSAR